MFRTTYVFIKNKYFPGRDWLTLFYLGKEYIEKLVEVFGWIETRRRLIYKYKFRNTGKLHEYY